MPNSDRPPAQGPNTTATALGDPLPDEPISQMTTLVRPVARSELTASDRQKPELMEAWMVEGASRPLEKPSELVFEYRSEEVNGDTKRVQSAKLSVRSNSRSIRMAVVILGIVVGVAVIGTTVAAIYTSRLTTPPSQPSKADPR